LQKIIFNTVFVFSLYLITGCGDGFSLTNDSDSIDKSIVIPDELTGKDLKRWLKNNYYTKKHKALSYKNARKE